LYLSGTRNEVENFGFFGLELVRSKFGMNGNGIEESKGNGRCEVSGSLLAVLNENFVGKSNGNSLWKMIFFFWVPLRGEEKGSIYSRFGENIMMIFGGGLMMIFLELACQEFFRDNNTSRAACMREPHGLHKRAARLV
jgi:hypothetical protein